MCRIAFRSVADADAYCSALVPADAAPAGHDLALAILHGGNDAFARFVPRQAERFSFASDGAVTLCWVPEPWPSLFLYDHRSRRGVQWMRDDTITEGLRTHPCLILFHAFLAGTDWVPIHAAAVGRDGRFLLLAGPGGSGKSTAALACTMQGWTYAGDDFVVVHPGACRVEPLYLSGRLRPGSQAALKPLLTRTQVATSDEFGDPRAELRLRPGTPGLHIGGGAIRAILLPWRGGADRVTIRPAGAAEATTRMLGSNTPLLPGFRASLYPKLLATLKAAPRFVVDTGPDPTQIPDALARFLETL